MQVPVLFGMKTTPVQRVSQIELLLKTIEHQSKILYAILSAEMKECWLIYKAILTIKMIKIF